MSPGPVERPGRQSLARIVVAIERHRREMARLLAGLDGIERVALSNGVPTLTEGRTDVSTLVSQLAGRLRMDDVRLGRLATELDGRMSSVVQNQTREETSHADALRPLP
jgi:hypothetical protein